MGLYLAGFARQALRHHGHPWQNLRIAIEHDYLPGDRIVFDALYAQVPFDYLRGMITLSLRRRDFPSLSRNGGRSSRTRRAEALSLRRLI
jgi:hypothetical protein